MSANIAGLTIQRYLQHCDINSTAIAIDAKGEELLVRSVLRDVVSDSWLLRMEHEAKRLGAIECPSFNPPIAHYNDENWVSLAYRWIPGTPLAKLVQEKEFRRDVDSLVESMLDVAEGVLTGLVAVHDAGFVHRDIRPSHIIRACDDTYTLCGYGPLCVANAVGSSGYQAIEFASYASPELAGSIDQDITPASDIYSLGLALFTILQGNPPFRGQDAGDILFQHLTVRPTFEGLGYDLADQLLQFVNRMLEKDTRDRYQTAASALSDLNSLRQALAEHDDLSKVIIGRHDRRSELTEPSFVGRTDEMDVIKGEIAEVASGAHRTLIAVGKSGMGKSRLLLEAIRVASQRGFSVYRSVASDQATQEPLGPLLSIIDSFAKHLSYNEQAIEFVAEELAEYSGEIATAMPALAKVLGWESGALEGPEELGQGRVAVAFCKALELCSFEGPTLIVVDDCQWLDKPSLRVLTEFFKSKPANVFLLVGSRPNEGMSEQLRESLIDARLLEFGELSTAGIHALIESMAGQLSDEVKNSVAAMAVGSPFLATAAMRGLVECQALQPTADGWKVDKEELEGFQAAGDSADILLKRLEFVDLDAMELMSIGAVIGKQFDIKISMELSGFSPEHTFSRIQLVRDQGLIWTRPDGTVAFVHDKIREAVVSKIGDSNRKQIHQQVAEYLHRNEPDRCFDLAYHYDKAGLPGLAWQHALEAAESARGTYALDSAEAQFRIAARAIDGEFESSLGVKMDQRPQHQIEAGLADVLMLLGKYEEAQHWLEKGLESAPSPNELAQVRLKQGDLAFKRGDKGEAMLLFEQALEDAGHKVPKTKFALGRFLLHEVGVQALHSIFPSHLIGHKEAPSESEKLAWRLYSKLAHCYWYVKDKYHTFWAHLRGMNSAELYKPTLELAQAYSEHAPGMSLIPWPSRGLYYARQSLQIRKEAQDIWGQGQSRNFLSIMFYSGARFEECMNQANQAVSVLERTGDYWEVHMAQYQAAAALYRLGKLKEAAKAAKVLYDSARKRGDEQSSGNAIDLWARASLGRVPSEVVELETSRDVVDHQGKCHLYLAEGVQCHMAGNFDKAIACFNRALEAVRKTGVLNAYITPNYAWLCTSLRCQLEANPPKHKKTNDRRRRAILKSARRAVRVAYRFRNEMPHALRELAAAEAMFGRTSRAIRLAKKSIKVSESQGAIYERAQSAQMLAELEYERRPGKSLADRLEAARDVVRGIEETVAETENATSLSLIDRFEVLLDAGRRITAATAVDSILSQAVKASERLLRGERVIILQATEDVKGKETFEICRPIGSNEEFDPQLILKARSANSTVIDHLERLDRHGLSVEQTGAFLVSPINVNDEAKYFLYVANTHINGLFGDDENRIASYLTSAASGALERASGFEQLEALNESLELRVIERTEAVVQRSKELEQTANELRVTQGELEAAKEAAEHASASKSDFLACMSHEIRTPMSAVLGFTEILRTREVGEREQKDYLRRIHVNGEHLLSLLNDVLDFSKIEAGKLQVERIACQPFELVSDAASALASRAEEKGVGLGVLTAGKIPETIYSDPTRLRQIVMNLVGNAIKFTSEGRVDVILEYEDEQDVGGETGSTLRVDVRDTGIGITQKQIDKIFDPFTQADASTSRQFGGTGLGLSICKSISEALGGGVEIKSVPGKGSTFSARIATGDVSDTRFIDHSEYECDLEKRTSGSTESKIEGSNLLLVDDVEANRELIGFLLEEAGANIEYACNGQEAIDMIESAKGKFDAVFMDMQMPVLDGYGATRKLRQSGFQKPIIAMTANSLKGDQEKCLESGCDEYIAKPVDFERLLEVANAYIGKDVHRSEEAIQLSEQPNPEATSASNTEIDEEDFEVAYQKKLRELGLGFLAELEETWYEFEDAVLKEDYETLKELAHRTKGTSATFGYEDLADSMESLEFALAENRESEIDSILNTCVSQLERSKAESLE